MPPKRNNGITITEINITIQLLLKNDVFNTGDFCVLFDLWEGLGDETALFLDNGVRLGAGCPRNGVLLGVDDGVRFGVDDGVLLGAGCARNGVREGVDDGVRLGIGCPCNGVREGVDDGVRLGAGCPCNGVREGVDDGVGEGVDDGGVLFKGDRCKFKLFPDRSLASY